MTRAHAAEVLPPPRRARGSVHLAAWMVACTLAFVARFAAQPAGPGEPLRAAIAAGDTAAVDALLASGTAVDQVIEGSSTPLFLAVARGDAAMVAHLLRRGARPDLACRGVPPLHLAIDLHTARHVFGATGAADRVADHDAGAAFLDIAEILLSHGAKVNAADSCPRPAGDTGFTALHVAAAGGDRDAALLLIAHRADLDARTARGRTPLDVALAAGHAELAALLVSHDGTSVER